MRKNLLPAILALYSALATAQTFTVAPDVAIHDDAPLVSSLEVEGLPDHITPDSFGLESVCLNISYSEVRHLIVTLYAPDGTMVKLAHLNGRDADHFSNTCFGESGQYFAWAKPPYYGGYQPILPLGVVNNGQNPNGEWKLVVEEFLGDDEEGILESWSITFGKHPAGQDTILKSSELPVVILNTGGHYIPDEPKIAAHMGVVAHSGSAPNQPGDPFNHYDGPVGVEWRGGSSKSFWQSSFGVETRDADGADNDVPLLGLPAGSDWVLHGPFTDKSLLRNALTCTLADEAGDAYVPRTRFCEVMLDGSYLGVYTLIESIRRGPDRVNIAKLRKSDTSGDALTGGYIVKVDRTSADGWYSRYRPEGGGKVYFNYVYPKAADIQAEQKAYIQAFVDSFETSLQLPGFSAPDAGWRRWADEESFIEHFIFNEAGKNVDAYRLSAYLFKPRDSEGGKLHAGPLWDFNLAWRNADYANNASPEGWTFEGEPRGVPFWWKQLLEDSLYAEHLKCRWLDLRRSTLSQRHIFNVIDSLSAALGAAKDRQFELYPILGHGLWPNPAPIAKTYNDEIANMKWWISRRLQWMDAHLPGACGQGAEKWKPAPWTIYPNPVRNILSVFFEQAPDATHTLELTDVSGRLIERKSNPGFEAGFDMSALADGFYLLVYREAGGKVLRVEKVVKM
ncbi:MAG: CotH kinase family protein [Saprospiraceae bacterium]|nr:CotH kinase family protein [Saprospiraceae bacterium]